MDGHVTEYDVKVTGQELQVIVHALHDAPYRVVAPLLAKLQAQVSEQDNASSMDLVAIEEKRGGDG